MLRAFRTIHRRWLADAYTGEGASFHGGRWNRIGTPVVYASASASLAVLELFVNLLDWESLPGHVIMPCAFDEQLVEELDARSLPDDWRRNPCPAEVTDIGQAWADSRRSPVLRVPSAVIPIEFNYLINPSHPSFREVRIEPPLEFAMDVRLARR